MSNLKTLLIILVVIFLVGLTGGEVYYLFFHQPPKPKAIQTQSNSRLSLSPNFSPNLSSDILQRYLLVTTNSALTSSFRTAQYRGQIVELNTNGGVEKRLNNLNYAAMLKIKGKGDIANQIFFTKEDLSKIEVVEKAGGEERVINFSELKVGDLILLHWTLEEIKSPYNNIINAKITKLQD